MKADIIHVAGYDTYDTHDSGSMIGFGALRALNMNSIMILGLERRRQDADTVYVPLRQIADSIEECKILIVDNTLEPDEIRKIHQKTNCKIILIAYTHFHITGGCGYPVLFDGLSVTQCNKFKEMCGMCPDIGSSKLHDKTYQLMVSKRSNLSDLPITVVVGSSHSDILTRESNIYKNLRIEFIPLPNDLFFCEQQKDDLQKASNLDPDIKYMLWGTTQPEQPRKGKVLFDKVLDILWSKLDTEQRKTIAIINVGPQPSSKFGVDSNFTTYSTGYISTRQQMSVLYRTADISVCTTVSDAGPMMITESCINETPVIAFDRSIAIDLIKDEQTGYLIKDLNLNDMADKIHKLLFHPKLDEISKNARVCALKLHDTDAVLSKWKALFDSLL